MPTEDTDPTAREEPPPNEESEDQADSMVVLEFTVSAGAFALERTLQEFPDVVVEYERLVPTSHHPLPYLWTDDGAASGLAAAISEEPRVESVTRVATFDKSSLYRIEWAPSENDLLHCVSTTAPETALLQAEGRGGEWALKLRFPSRAALSDFQAFYEEREIDLHVVRLYGLTEPKLGQYDITPKQREALLRALEMGYFEIPRETTLEAVAESMDISRMAASERLRRGQTNLVGNSLTIGRPTGVGLGEQ
jgi:predicted DNA binding protein